VSQLTADDCEALQVLLARGVSKFNKRVHKAGVTRASSAADPVSRSRARVDPPTRIPFCALASSGRVSVRCLSVARL